MKLAVFSDSHGSPEKMLEAIRLSNPDLIIHLGDSQGDTSKIKKQFPQIPLKAVRGNCDMSINLAKAEILTLCGFKLFLTHGHLHSVKSGLSLLYAEAKSLGAHAALYGHTHMADVRMEKGIYLINPGCCGYGAAPSYAEIYLDEKRGIIPHILSL
jgi:putative phosphoesterase